MYSLGIRNFITDFAILDQFLMNFLTWFSGICILLWMIGHILGLLFIKNKNKNISKSNNNKFIIKKTLSDVILLILFLGFVIIAGKPLLSGMYDGGKNWGDNATYFFLLLRSFLIVRIFYFFYSLKNDNKSSIYKNIFNNKILVSITVLYIFLFFIGGQRSTILELLILIVSCYSIYIKKINFVLVLVGITIGGFVFTLLGMGRTGDSNDLTGNIVERGLNKANSSDEFILPTDELAGSNKVSYLALDYFPDRIDFMNGKILLLDIVGVIPFGSRLLGDNLSEVETTSPVLFTYLDQGKYSSYGTGSDVVSDIYINFGVYGTIVVFFFFGFCIALVQYKFNIEKDFYWSIVSVTIIISAIFINRAQLLSPLKDIFYALIFARLFFKKVSVKNS
jgi:oligosaccharide repeat unit polymerase